MVRLPDNSPIGYQRPAEAEPFLAGFGKLPLRLRRLGAVDVEGRDLHSAAALLAMGFSHIYGANRTPVGPAQLAAHVSSGATPGSAAERIPTPCYGRRRKGGPRQA